MTFGFRVKSGYAIAVILDGTADRPIAVARRVVDLSDPAVEETRQPYHSGFGEAEEDTREIARRVKIIERAAKKSIAALVAGVPVSRGKPARVRAGLVVGSLIDPASVGNPHIRAHANEGRLFRTVLEGALRSEGIASDVFVEKQLGAAAAQGLGRRDIARTMAAFGKTLGSPWRAEEKAAATAAWLVM